MRPFNVHIHCAWCVAPHYSQLSVLFLNGQPSNTPSTTYVCIEGTHTIAAVPLLKILTPEDGHIGRNM
jgi:hypothetical protein